MSQRGDRGEGHARRPGRSSSFGGNRGGGVGGAGKGGGPSGGQPPLSSNRSFRKPTNGHGGHQRVVSQTDTTGFQPAPAPGSLQTPPRPPVPQNVPVHVPVPATRSQYHDSSGVQAPSMPPAIENLPPKNIPHAAPRAPPKSSNTSAPQAGTSKGESSKGFSLQFGSINMNGIPQFPARTSSAPPNLDEQKRNQALPEGLKVAPSVPVQPALKQQQPQLPPPQQKQPQPPQPQPQLQPKQHTHQQIRKDTVGSNQPNSVNPHVPSQVKRDVHVSPSIPNVAPPRPPVQPMPMPMPFHHQQTQVPLQFGGHNPQMPPQGIVPSSLQMPMGLPGGNAPQVQPQIYLQHHQLQQQAMMHQGQGMPFVPSGGHQLTPQLGNLMAPQYPQQQANKFVGPRKTTVKITHPETREELKLDMRMDSSGQRTLPNVTTQSQPVGGFTHMGFYPSMSQSSYNQPPVFYPSSTGVSHLPTGSQGPRFNYQAGQPLPFINPSMLNTVTASTKDNVAGPAATAQSHITVKPHPAGLSTEKSGAHTVTISAPPGKSDAPKLKMTEDAVPHRQKDNEVVPGITVSNKSAIEKESKAASVTEKHPSMVSQSLPIQGAKHETRAPSSHVPNSTTSGADEKKREAIQRSESFKDNKKNSTKKDVKNFLQQPQPASSPEDLKVQTSMMVGGDGVGHVETKTSTKELDVRSSASGLTAALSESKISPGVGTVEAESMTVNAADVPGMDGSSEKSEAGVSAMDGSSAKSASESTGEPQRVECLASVGVMSEESEISLKNSLDFSDDKISSDSTENESHEACTMNLAEQASTRTSNPDSLDATACLADQQQLLKESTASVFEEHSIMNRSHRNTEVLSDSVDANDVSLASSETSIVSTFQSANYKIDTSNSHQTGLSDSVSSITPDVLPVTHSVASEEPQYHESRVKDQSSAPSAASVRPASREKPSVEITRTKSTAGKKKKRKEMLSKADAAGTSDLYNAYKGPEEKSESISTAEDADSSIVNATDVLPDELEREVNMGEDDGKKKVEPDDWEDAADMSTPKLQTPDSGNQASVAPVPALDTTEANGRKRYSRDFLLTLAQHYTDLPVGFQMGDVTSVLISNLAGKSYVVDREPHPSPGRGNDRPASRSDRRGAAMDDDRWTKSGIPFSPGRDSHMDLTNGPASVNYRGPPGVSHGVVRNSRGGSGGLVGSAPANAPQVPRSGSDADRWQQRGLIPSPVTPMLMHKAGRKYIVGKVSDEEEAKQRQLKAILNKLTPQNFEKLFIQVKEVNIDSVATLTGVISQIFDKALMEPTFCEMYANFCFHLASALPDFSEDNEKITFKRLLLNKCQEEFERGEREEAEAEKTEEEGEVKQTKEEREEKRIRARRRMLGNIRLIGELYKKRMLTERIMHECIKKLLGNCQHPDEENIEALCKLMSTIGEMIDHPKAKEHMDAYFDIMLKLSTSQLLSSRVRFMLRDSIDLRKNRWQQRRKVEGPKKIEEVHRDAAQERHAQSSRLSRGPVVSSLPRRGAAPMDYGTRGSASALVSSGSQQIGIRGTSQHSRGGTQDIRFEERQQFDRTVPLPQRFKDANITLGPQGGLAKGMSVRGQPPISNAELPSVPDQSRLVSGPNGYNSVASTAREDPRRSAPMQSAGPSPRPASQEGRSGNKSYSEEDLREKSIAAIREYYSAKDEKEVALCIEELNAPRFYPTVVSLWVNDSFERKEMERELLAKLFVSFCNGRDNLLSKPQLIEGLTSVLTSLEDALSDAPRASEYLGRLFARFVMENIVPLQEVGRLIEEGGEEPGYLIREGIAADVLWAVFESIRVEKGDSFLNEAKASSNLKLEDFRPHHSKRSKLDAFM